MADADNLAPLVLLHAFPLDGRMWMPQAEALANTRQVIVPDMRGFGAGYAHLGGLREIPIDLAADDLAQSLDERGIGKAVVAGISRGAYVAMAFARRHAGRLAGLILLDSRATPADENERQHWGQTVERLETEGIGFLPEVMQNRLLGPTALAGRPELAVRVREIISSQKADGVAAAARGMATRPDARPGLSQIRVPVLAMAGTEDAAFASTKAMADGIPGARFIEIPATGHLTNLERPELVTLAIRRFLENL
jgi:pimeloyl-ACP methyl ester carboxylesterase